MRLHCADNQASQQPHAHVRCQQLFLLGSSGWELAVNGYYHYCEASKHTWATYIEQRGEWWWIETTIPSIYGNIADLRLPGSSGKVSIHVS